MNEHATLSIVEGMVENIVFQNEDTGFTVLELDKGDELLTVVGEMPFVSEGEQLKVTGVYTTHPQFGPQFKCQLCERSMPASTYATYKYLSSGAFKGVGPALARRMVDAFGEQTLDVIENDPVRLQMVKGITVKKAQQLQEEFSRVFGMKTVMAFLAEYQIEPFYSVRLWKKFGPEAIDRIRENPFVLCAEDVGVPFESADLICAQLQILPDSLCRVSAGLQYVLKHNMASGGHTCLPKDKLLETTLVLLGRQVGMDTAEEALQQELDAGLLVCEDVRDREYVYLPSLHTAELYVAERIGMVVSLFSGTDSDYEKRIERLEQSRGITYAALQKKAISLAMTQGVSILTGGPGTGKTTAINAILGLMEEDGLHVAIAAPTGRAAKRISEITGREAKTIHRLLEVDFTDGNASNRFKHHERNPIDCDAVIVDEMSMVDILLFEALLRALRLSTKLVLAGDSDQLPSVGAGRVLSDLIRSECVTSTCLTEIFRQAAQSKIVVGAHSIVRGEMPELSRKDSDFFFLSTQDYTSTAKTVADLCSRRLPASYALSPFTDIQVLAPSRVGELGTSNLNGLLQQALNPKEEGKAEIRFEASLFREGDKVMQTKNNYDVEWVSDSGEIGMGMYNGDIGIIKRIDKKAGIVVIKFDDKTTEYASDMLGEVELAYAITVHKSQGSEFEAVIIPLMNAHPKLYYRNLLYTAVTRAKRLLIILGKPYTLRNMIANNRKTLRYTNLGYFLRRFQNLE